MKSFDGHDGTRLSGPIGADQRERSKRRCRAGSASHRFNAKLGKARSDLAH